MFSYLFSDWLIQNFGEILSKKFWIDQSEEREGKFKFQNWSNFGPKELEIGTRYLESNFSFVIHMSKRLFFEQTGQIWGGVKGPSGEKCQFIEQLLMWVGGSIKQNDISAAASASDDRHLMIIVCVCYKNVLTHLSTYILRAHTDFKCHFQSKMKKKSKMLWHQLFWVNNLLQTREQSDQEEFVA